MSKNNNQQYKNYSEDYNGKIGINTNGQKFQLIKSNSDPVYNYEVRDMDGNHIYSIREQCIPKFFNKIYKPSESKIFDKAPETIEEVLPKVFLFQDEGIQYNIRYDNMSSQEKLQIQKDIHTAYENLKKLFDVNKPETTLNLEVNVFNNKNDYQKYNELAGIDADNAYGATDGKTIVVFKFPGMDFVLGHELGHVFQDKLLINMKSILDSELFGNFIGSQVEEENKKDIDSGQIEEYKTEEYDNPAHNEVRKSDEGDKNTVEEEKTEVDKLHDNKELYREKREVQKETAKLDDNTEESQSTQTSEPGILSFIFGSLISWIWGTEEESESIELSHNSLYSDPLSDESHYSQSDTNNII
ncbi:hypothetical protein [Wolbachia endosymbiont of Cantharis cryptica]|uniref:hypothetical protein n=1 Tax=Wolbachia endosymbiont of Cantharis cryptica TaxID=3066132 RepID=UPI00376ED9BB